MPVHLYGQMADMRALARARRRDAACTIVEDACQAHGAERDGLRAGAAGDAAAFSFYPGKNLGAMGDAGALVTDDDALAARRARAARARPDERSTCTTLEGYTARLDTIQALVLLRKLPLLDGWNDERRAAAALYGDGARGRRRPRAAARARRAASPSGTSTSSAPRIRHALAAFLARARHRRPGRHYPRAAAPVAGLRVPRPSRRGAFPVAEALAASCLSLPIFPGITRAAARRRSSAASATYFGVADAPGQRRAATG